MVTGPRSLPEVPARLLTVAASLADAGRAVATWAARARLSRCPSWIGPLSASARQPAGDLYWYGWVPSQANSRTRNWDYTFWRWPGMDARADVAAAPRC